MSSPEKVPGNCRGSGLRQSVPLGKPACPAEQSSAGLGVSGPALECKETRDPVFADLDRRIAEEEENEAARPKRRKSRPRKRTREKHGGKSPLAKAKKEGIAAAERIKTAYPELNRAELIQVGREILKALTPPRKRGRRPDQIVTRAVEMFKAGEDWRKHLPRLIEDWREMGEWRKKAKINKLENSVRKRLTREKNAPRI